MMKYCAMPNRIKNVQEYPFASQRINRAAKV